MDRSSQTSYIIGRLLAISAFISILAIWWLGLWRLFELMMEAV